MDNGVVARPGSEALPDAQDPNCPGTAPGTGSDEPGVENAEVSSPEPGPGTPRLARPRAVAPPVIQHALELGAMSQRAARRDGETREPPAGLKRV